MPNQLALAVGSGGPGEVELAISETVTRHVLQERRRIARELHDVVAASFATINVQAGVAVHVLDERPDQASEALRAIKDASREALREIRAILGLLRQDDDPSDEQVSLSRLDELADRVAAAGAPTRIITLGVPRPLGAEVDRAAYRIVQESLTNVLRHAGPASARVWVEYDEAGVSIEIEDDGAGQVSVGDGASSSPGYGIVGMRERASAAGGELEAAPRPAGGFSVRTFLPSPIA
jgi:signal transduction histidine kinase